MSKQLLRSGTSVIANYIEAGAASSKKDFINFFHHALKSANESKVWLTLLRDTNRGAEDELKQLLDELEHSGYEYINHERKKMILRFSNVILDFSFLTFN